MTLRTRLGPLLAALVFVGAPLAAQAPAPLPPTSPPPTAPVVAPTPAVKPVDRSGPLPSQVAPGARAADPVITATPQNQPAPPGATMRCKDGTWLTGAPSASRCDRNGGLAVIVPVRAAPPPPPRAP